jgi:transposase-like protein
MTTNNEKSKTELCHRFIEMRAKGISIRSIAKELGVSPQTLCNWQTELDDEISRRKAVELEALYEKNLMLKEHRINFFGQHINRLQEELKNRNLTDISTDRLFDLLLKYIDEAAKDMVTPHFSNNNGSKMDSSAVSAELSKLFSRYGTGAITEKHTRQIVSILMSILKAEEQTEIRDKLDKLTSILDRG